MKIRSFCLTALLLAVSSVVLAQGVSRGPVVPVVVAPSPGPLTYGSQTTIYAIAAWDFEDYTAGNTLAAVGDYRFMSSGAYAEGHFHLPNGALVIGADLEACDDTATGDVNIGFGPCPDGNNGCDFAGRVITTGYGQIPGCGRFVLSLAPANQFQIDNNVNEYIVQISTSGNITPETRFGSVRIQYKLQVSPAPATATFNDVSNAHPFYRFIEALAASGITGGCGGGNFCPNAPITRGEMAVFLAGALGLHFPN